MENNISNHHQLNNAEAFRIEIAVGSKGRFFDVKPLGDYRYEIADQDGILGSIRLDGQDHARCESQGCELDLPLLEAIRDGIQFHEQWSPRA